MKDRELRQSDLSILTDDEVRKLRQSTVLLSDQAKKSAGFYSRQQSMIDRELNRRGGERRKEHGHA